MDYGDLIREAWRMTWNHRFLWVLALFGGGGSGFSFGNGGGNFNSLFDGSGSGSGGRIGSGTGFESGLAEVGRWLGDNLAVIVTVVLLLLLLLAILLVVAFIAQGGLTGATVDLARGRPASFRSAVRTGLRLFWRNGGLALLLFFWGMLVMLLIAGFVGATVWLAMSVQEPVWVILPAVLLGLVLFAVCVAVGITLSIVVPFATRAIAALDIGPLAALRDGWQVVRARPGTSFLVWLVHVGLSICTGIAAAIIAVLLLLVLALPALIVWFGFEPQGTSLLWAGIAYGTVAGIIWFCVMFFMGAVSNTFHWSYWTLAYLRLRAQTLIAPTLMPPSVSS